MDAYKNAEYWSYLNIQAFVPTLSLTDDAPTIVADTYEAGNVTYTRTTTAEKYASFCLPYDIDLGSTSCFTKVYTPMDEVLYNTKTERLCLMFKSNALDSTIPAGTPFVGLMNGNDVLLSNKEAVTFTGEEKNPEPKQLLVFNYSGSGALWQNEDINVKQMADIIKRNEYLKAADLNSDGNMTIVDLAQLVDILRELEEQQGIGGEIGSGSGAAKKATVK